MRPYSFELARELLAAWRVGRRGVRVAIALSGVLVAAGLVLFGLGCLGFPIVYPSFIRKAGGFSAILGALVSVGVSALQRAGEEIRTEERIKEAEKRVQEDPRRTQAAWDLARTRL